MNAIDPRAKAPNKNQTVKKKALTPLIYKKSNVSPRTVSKLTVECFIT